MPESQRERRAVRRIFPDRAPGESEGYQTDSFGRHTIFAQWANGPENKQSLRNLIGYYTELPAGFRLEIRAERPEKRGNLSDITGSDTRKTWTESHDTAGRSVEDYDREEREKQEKILRRYRAMDIRRVINDDGSD